MPQFMSKICSCFCCLPIGDDTICIVVASTVGRCGGDCGGGCHGLGRSHVVVVAIVVVVDGDGGNHFLLPGWPIHTLTPFSHWKGKNIVKVSEF